MLPWEARKTERFYEADGLREVENRTLCEVCGALSAFSLIRLRGVSPRLLQIFFFLFFSLCLPLSPFFSFAKFLI